MARQTEDREDLLRDATAFDRRISFSIELDDKPVEIFAGFRPAGAVSFYFGADPVYQFNSQNELRRAYFHGRLVKAELGRLFFWSQHRTENSLEMQREEMHDREQEVFCRNLLKNLAAVRQAISDNNFNLIGVVPEQTDVMQNLLRWLMDFSELKIADTPNVC